MAWRSAARVASRLMAGRMIDPLIPALLLQITLFNTYAQEAAAKMGVKGVTVEEAVVNYNQARRLAWVNSCTWIQPYSCGSYIIYIGYDVTRTASPKALRYLAYHEVCHLKLGHNLYPLPAKSVYESHVDVCMQRTLGNSDYLNLLGVYQSYSNYMSKLRQVQFGGNLPK